MIWPDLGPNCLPRLSADDTGRQRVKVKKVNGTAKSSERKLCMSYLSSHPNQLYEAKWPPLFQWGPCVERQPASLHSLFVDDSTNLLSCDGGDDGDDDDGVCDDPICCFLIWNHYDNTPMQNAASFNGCENDNCKLKSLFFLFIFTQNIDRGYFLELPQ